MTPALFTTTIPSPIGPLTLLASDRGLRGVFMDNHRHPPEEQIRWISNASKFIEARRQIDEYFDGTRREFDLILDFQGTPFQIDVWKALLTVPYGETASYADQAARIGRAKAVRAVGSANGQNPLSIVVPCHRIIGKNGSLTGYGGGLPRKQFLLAHEARVAKATAQ